MSSRGREPERSSPGFPEGPAAEVGCRAIPAPRRTPSSHSLAGYEKGHVPREVRERQLLEVAERCFAEHGYQGTSLEIVAREAGVSRQYLAKLFGDRDGLYLACHRRARDQLNARFVELAERYAQQPEAFTAGDLVRAGATAFFTFVRDRGAGWDVLFGTGLAVAGSAFEQVERMRDETVELIGALLRAAGPPLPDEEVAIIANALSGAGTQVALWWRHTDLPLEALVDRYVAFFWRGLEPYATAAARAG